MKNALLAALLIISSTAFACSRSSQVPTPFEKYANADVVFIGTVTSIRSDIRWIGRYEMRTDTVTFAVHEALKLPNGTQRLDSVVLGTEVPTSTNTGTCGYEFEQNETLLIYGYGGAFEQNTTSVYHVRSFSSASVAGEDIKAIRALTQGQPEPDSGERTSWRGQFASAVFRLIELARRFWFW